MKRITISVMTILLVGVIMGGSIYASFSDSETAAENTFTAGTLNLQVGSADPCTDKVTLSGIKPADTGNAAIWLVKNLPASSVSGSLGLSTSTITDNENTITEPESAAGDVTTPAGELGGLLEIALWMDADKSGAWSSGDYYVTSSQTKVSWASGTTLPVAAYEVVDNFASKAWTGLQTVAANSDAGNFRIEYNFPDGGSGDNVAQGDSCVFDITFTLS